MVAKEAVLQFLRNGLVITGENSFIAKQGTSHWRALPSGSTTLKVMVFPKKLRNSYLCCWGNYKQLLSHFYCRQRPRNRQFPWEVLESGIQQR